MNYAFAAVLGAAMGTIVATGAFAEDDMAGTDHPWSGLYAGVHAGLGFASFDGIFDGADSVDRQDDLGATGFMGLPFGGQVGYDFAVNGLVLGVVGDFGTVLGSGDTASATNDGVLETSYNWVASARARVGKPMGDFMPYVTVGIARASVTVSHEFILFDDPSLNGSKNITDSGTVFGAGIEWVLKDNVTLGAEALVYDFNVSDDLVDLGNDRDFGDGMTAMDLVQARVALNFRF